jgi:hypothetical protein
MPTQVQFRRGNEGQNNNFKGAAGEISVNTSTNSIRVHNGIATGGFELARADLSNVGNVSLSGIVTATAFVGDGSQLTGIQDLTGPWVSEQVGIYTNSYVGIGTTNPEYDLHVIGNARITGILTVGNASITIDGNTNNIVIGSGVTVYGNTGIISASAFYVGDVDLASASGYASTAGIATVASGLTTTASVNTSGIVTATAFVGDGSGLTNIELSNLEDINLPANNAPSDGRALIYQNGEWIVGPVIGGVDYVPSGGEPNYDDVVALFGFNGDNGSTSAIDESPLAANVTLGTGGSISSTDPKFGTGSLRLLNSGSSEYPLTTIANTNHTLGTRNWTMEGWFKFDNTTIGFQHLFVHGALFNSISTSSNTLIIRWDYQNAGTGFAFQFYNGSNSVFQNATVFPYQVTSSWQHIAFVRDGSTIRGFVNGVQIGTYNIGSASIATPTNRRFGTGAQINGYIDEWRITLDVARYTANFTPPTEAFLRASSLPVNIPYSIDRLSDVDTSTVSPSNGQSLVWNSETQLWIPSSSLIYSQNSGIATVASGLTTTASVNTSGIVTATAFVGDGSGLTNIISTGTGVEVRDNGSIVGTASTIDFGDNLDVTFSAGIMTVTGASGAEFLKNESGISTTSSVGIGTTQPVAKLHVNGAIALSASPIFMGKNTVEESVTVPSGYNSMSIGPILTVGTGVTVTIESGANWFVLGQ